MMSIKKTFILSMLLAGILLSVFAFTPSPSLKVLSFNVLAPCWASAQYFPGETASLLEREARRDRIINFLQSQANSVDIVALQETTELEMWYFKQALKDKFVGFGAYHYPYYWSHSITQDLPWEPNGVAIFVKKDIFHNIEFQEIKLSEAGNHAAFIQANHKKNGKKIRIASIHLDSESAYNRFDELKSLLQFMPSQPVTVDVIAGDFNDETKHGVLKQIVIAANFVDVLGALSQEKQTSPYAWGVIDHVLIRNGIPTEAQVFNAALWKIYPDNEKGRVSANLLMYGSDHFPISASFKFSR